MQVSAIILAGGKSKRMGTDKAFLEIDGTTLLKKAIDLCKNICNEIIISSNKLEHKIYGYAVIADEIENCGPLGGISSCLKQSKTDWNLVISVDAAYVDADFLKFILTEISDFDAIVPFSEKGKEPLIAIYNKSCLPVLKSHLKNSNLKMHNLLSAINTKFVDTQVWVEKYPKLFHNLNRPEDL